MSNCTESPRNEPSEKPAKWIVCFHSKRQVSSEQNPGTENQKYCTLEEFEEFLNDLVVQILEERFSSKTPPTQCTVPADPVHCDIYQPASTAEGVR